MNKRRLSQASLLRLPICFFPGREKAKWFRLRICFFRGREKAKWFRLRICLWFRLPICFFPSREKAKWFRLPFCFFPMVQTSNGSDFQFGKKQNVNVSDLQFGIRPGNKQRLWDSSLAPYPLGHSSLKNMFFPGFTKENWMSNLLFRLKLPICFFPGVTTVLYAHLQP